MTQKFVFFGDGQAMGRPVPAFPGVIFIGTQFDADCLQHRFQNRALRHSVDAAKIVAQFFGDLRNDAVNSILQLFPCWCSGNFRCDRTRMGL